MDDLRLEHQRVQQKYVAMTKALIESCDIDAFRVDCVAKKCKHGFSMFLVRLSIHICNTYTVYLHIVT